MIKLAIKDNPRFDVSEIELNRDGPTYSVDSIPVLKEQYDGAELYFLLGLDALKDIYKWEQPGKIIEMCRVVGLTRPGHMAIDWAEIDSALPGASQKIQTIEVSQIEVSSSDIRMMVANDMSIRFLVPDAVINYIAKQGLYMHN
jgi:nicotinate-nucleotide adenylyltransferase